MAEERFGGAAHILSAHGARSKRVSYSTSHSETLAAIVGLEIGGVEIVRDFHKTGEANLAGLSGFAGKGHPTCPSTPTQTAGISTALLLEGRLCHKADHGEYLCWYIVELDLLEN